MIPFHKSIGFRILLISFILLALPLLVDSFIFVQRSYEHAIEDAKGYLAEIANKRELPLTGIQPVNKTLFDVLVNFLGVKKHFPQEPNEELNEKLQGIAKAGGFYGVFLLKVTPDNRLIVVGSGLPQFIGRDYTDFFVLNSFYSQTIFEKGYATYISYDNETLQPFFIVAYAIRAPDGRPLGVMTISDDISKNLKEILKPDLDRYPVNFALLLPSSIVYAASDEELVFNYFHPLNAEYRKYFMEEEPSAEFLPKKPLKIVTNKTSSPYLEFTWKGKTQLGYIKKFERSDFSILAYASKEAIIQAPLITFFNIYSVYGAILIIGGTLAYLLTMRMAKPIQSLSHVMQQIQQGDLQKRYQHDPLGFEINVLGSVFNQMVDAVIEQKRIVEEERVKRETFARELRLGQQVQRNLLPQAMPVYPGVEIAERYIPAIEVGGDFFDVFVKRQREKEQLVLSVADASGKGVHACFYSLSLRNMLRTYTKEYDDIAHAMLKANNLFRQDTAESGMFVTVLMGVYDHESGNFNYYSCGHNPGLIRREDGTVERLDHPGIAMGVSEVEEAHTNSVQLNKGDTLVLYTDGITEAHDEEFRQYGEERLTDCLAKEGGESPAEIIERLVSDVTAFAGKAPQHDDITLLVMKVK